jgi:branched-subunit amino acid aminotransferase/4-amino-4-deoxychorismate lyase
VSSDSVLPAEFELLETFRWSPAHGFGLRERHVARAQASAEYFGFRFDRTQIERALDDAMAGHRGERRVRLLMSKDGRPRVEHCAMEPSRTMRVAVAAAPVDPTDVFLLHKTTRRDVYQRAAVAGFDDTILWNTRGELTESTVGNIVVDVNGVRVTPPVVCGLLPGTFRGQLLADGEVEEGVVAVETLRRLGACWIVNSVHGWRRAELDGRVSVRPRGLARSHPRMDNGM